MQLWATMRYTSHDHIRYCCGIMHHPIPHDTVVLYLALLFCFWLPRPEEIWVLLLRAVSPPCVSCVEIAMMSDLVVVTLEKVFMEACSPPPTFASTSPFRSHTQPQPFTCTSSSQGVFFVFRFSHLFSLFMSFYSAVLFCIFLFAFCFVLYFVPSSCSDISECMYVLYKAEHCTAAQVSGTS